MKSKAGIKTRVIERKEVSPEYAVTTVARGGKGGAQFCRQPCKQCPWRADVPPGVFPPDAFRHSARTAYDMSESGFACHMTSCEAPAWCAGFLLRGAEHNLSVRLAQIHGRLDMSKVHAAGMPLYADYRAMAEANGVPSDDEALAECR